MNFINLMLYQTYQYAHNIPSQVLNFRHKSIGVSLEESTTIFEENSKKTTSHQYPRHRSEEHENPTHNITPNTLMLQPIPQMKN